MSYHSFVWQYYSMSQKNVEVEVIFFGLLRCLLCCSLLKVCNDLPFCTCVILIFCRLSMNDFQKYTNKYKGCVWESKRVVCLKKFLYFEKISFVKIVRKNNEKYDCPFEALTETVFSRIFLAKTQSLYFWSMTHVRYFSDKKDLYSPWHAPKPEQKLGYRYLKMSSSSE